VCSRYSSRLYTCLQHQARLTTCHPLQHSGRRSYHCHSCSWSSLCDQICLLSALTWTLSDAHHCSCTTPREQGTTTVSMVPGYPAAVQVWNWTGWSSPGCYPENRGTHRVRGRVGTGPRFHITVPSTFAQIKYLSSDRIVTWSVRRLCSISPSFASHCPICDWSNFRWIAVKEGDISAEKCGFSIATQRILVRSQMWQREVKEGLKLHNLRTDHVTVRSELIYLVRAKIVYLKCRVFGENPLQRSGTDPGN